MNRTAPRGPFAHSWQASILAQRPLILPGRSFIYPHYAEEAERGALEVMIFPQGDAAFLATCVLGFADPLAPTGLWSHPNPDVLCAAAGGYVYLVPTRNPERCEQVPLRPVLAVEAVAEPVPLLLFVGNRSILAYGAEGKAWESGLLSDEGVTITGISGERLEGLGWEMATDREVAFVLDLRDGTRVAAELP